MIDLIQTSYVFQAFAATLFTYLMTALGASMVFFFKEIKKNVLIFMLGFASGVMIAASYWSLLAPAIEIAAATNLPKWLMPVLGFLSGGIFLWVVDKILPHIHFGKRGSREGIKTSWNRSVLLVLSITLHNIPEGLAVGVAFGSVASGIEGASLAGAIALAFGIGIQNFPEGAAVSIPLRRENMSRRKSFFYGQMSGVVEPIAAVIGALLVSTMEAILPFALSFAAGAMIFVVAEELIPESQNDSHGHLATFGVMLGFAIMMFLDVALG